MGRFLDWIDEGGLSQMWAVLPLGRWFGFVNESRVSLSVKFPPGLLLALRFLPWLSSVVECDVKVVGWNKPLPSQDAFSSAVLVLAIGSLVDCAKYSVV